MSAIANVLWIMASRGMSMPSIAQLSSSSCPNAGWKGIPNASPKTNRPRTNDHAPHEQESPHHRIHRKLPESNHADDEEQCSIPGVANHEPEEKRERDPEKDGGGELSIARRGVQMNEEL